MKPVYLDYNATTPTDPVVVQAMLPFFTEDFGNPANTLNSYGWAAENAVKKASQNVADLIGCEAHELTWNAGATEGNNTVVFGLIQHIKQQNPLEKIHFITSCAEHLSVINSFRAAQKIENIEVDFIPVTIAGEVELGTLKKYVKPHTKLVSCMWINNEIGSINPIHELAEFCTQNKIYFHTDATQAVGKIEINLKKTPVHFLTFSAHKFYGPKGVGCLFTRSNHPHVEIEPLIFGGGQQKNRRSGTLNVPAIVGAGKAAELCQNRITAEFAETKNLLKFIFDTLKTEFPQLKLNGPTLEKRSPINLSLTFHKPIDSVLGHLAAIAFSQGSACSTTGITSSHVLKSIGLTLPQAQQTIRLSIGRWTTQPEAEIACKTIIAAFKSI